MADTFFIFGTGFNGAVLLAAVKEQNAYKLKTI